MTITVLYPEDRQKLTRARRAQLRALDHPFDPPVWDEPHQRNQQVDRACDPRIDEREQDAGGIEHRRNPCP